MELLEKSSILLSLGDLTLKDTNNTFGKKKEVNGIIYEPLKKQESFNPYPDQLANFVTGDHRQGAKISKGDASIYLAYGANRPSSAAFDLAIGYKKENGYYFLREGFFDNYSENPKLVTRDVVTINSLWNLHQAFYRMILHHGTVNPITKKELEEFKIWVEKVKRLEEAFQKENLDELSTVRKRRIDKTDK